METSEGYARTADGVRLYFMKIGDGSPALAIPNGFHLLDDFRALARQRTFVVYDVRNRGRSDAVDDAAKLTRGVLNDIDDLETIRRYFSIDRLDVLAHSYACTVAATYAMNQPQHVGRVVLIAPMAPEPDAKYPPPLSYDDGVLNAAFAQLALLERERQSLDAVSFCRKWWSALRVIYVADPANAARIHWDRCELPNERNFMSYWMRHLHPSIARLDLSAAALARATAPTLILHGTKDRSAAYGGGRDWALRLPNARLITVRNVGHAPWIEAAQDVFAPIETFLQGAWPETAEKVTALDPSNA